MLEEIARAEIAANMARNAAERLRTRPEEEIVLPGIGRISRKYLADAFEAYARDLEEVAWQIRHGATFEPVPSEAEVVKALAAEPTEAVELKAPAEEAPRRSRSRKEPD